MSDHADNSNNIVAIIEDPEFKTSYKLTLPAPKMQAFLNNPQIIAAYKQGMRARALAIQQRGFTPTKNVESPVTGQNVDISVTPNVPETVNDWAQSQDDIFEDSGFSEDSNSFTHGTKFVKLLNIPEDWNAFQEVLLYEFNSKLQNVPELEDGSGKKNFAVTWQKKDGFYLIEFVSESAAKAASNLHVSLMGLVLQLEWVKDVTDYTNTDASIIKLGTKFAKVINVPEDWDCFQEVLLYEINSKLQRVENLKDERGKKEFAISCQKDSDDGFFYVEPTASVFHGNRRFADCDPIAQFDRFDPRTTIGLPLEVRAVSRALDFLIPVSEALPQRAAATGNVKREKHFPEWESNFGPLTSVIRALPTEPRRHDDCIVRRVRVVFALSSWLEAAGYAANTARTRRTVQSSWRRGSVGRARNTEFVSERAAQFCSALQISLMGIDISFEWVQLPSTDDDNYGLWTPPTVHKFLDALQELKNKKPVNKWNELDWRAISKTVGLPPDTCKAKKRKMYNQHSSIAKSGKASSWPYLAKVHKLKHNSLEKGPKIIIQNIAPADVADDSNSTGRASSGPKRSRRDRPCSTRNRAGTSSRTRLHDLLEKSVQSIDTISKAMLERNQIIQQRLQESF
ncbi:Tyrosine--tRNA ligase [Frankliniella fusca]|uniref:Tyrosine--tRNA ligase n=1 Tax=Frankliniella fusca TaxID=407009 RepID=A0AAE1L4L1_9NEOP|nr:Tyrosine--tRNA ligase [Frankliniella fusca]